MTTSVLQKILVSLLPSSYQWNRNTQRYHYCTKAADWDASTRITLFFFTQISTIIMDVRIFCVCHLGQWWAQAVHAGYSRSHGTTCTNSRNWDEASINRWVSGPLRKQSWAGSRDALLVEALWNVYVDMVKDTIVHVCHVIIRWHFGWFFVRL